MSGNAYVGWAPLVYTAVDRQGMQDQQGQPNPLEDEVRVTRTSILVSWTDDPVCVQVSEFKISEDKAIQ